MYIFYYTLCVFPLIQNYRPKRTKDMVARAIHELPLLKAINLPHYMVEVMCRKILAITRFYVGFQCTGSKETQKKEK